MSTETQIEKWSFDGRDVWQPSNPAENVCRLMGPTNKRAERGRLIAAAPAMLEALKLAARHIPPDSFAWRGVAEQLRAAIAAAEGGEA